MEGCKQQQTRASITSIPYEIHLQILSYLYIEDQISAFSTSFPPWQHALSQSKFLRKLRYETERPFLYDDFHPLLNTGLNWLGMTVKNSQIKSYNLLKLRYMDNEEGREISPRYTELTSFKEIERFIIRRSYSYFENPTDILDISTCPFLDETFFSTDYEGSQSTTDTTGMDYPRRYVDPYPPCDNNIREGFPVMVHTSVDYWFADTFHIFRVSTDEIPGFTLRNLLLFIAGRLGEVLGRDLESQPKVDVEGGGGGGGGGGGSGSQVNYNYNNLGLRMDPTKEYQVFVHQGVHNLASWGRGDVGAQVGMQVVVVPCDSEEMSYVRDTKPHRKELELSHSLVLWV
ncbi:hypothetical protein AA313_de0209333 [Arthrobotrys entomopaga]|nr:hypothetical protein AA313_de0209333 [Arthrobotrys entomopaga]